LIHPVTIRVLKFDTEKSVISEVDNHQYKKRVYDNENPIDLQAQINYGKQFDSKGVERITQNPASYSDGYFVVYAHEIIGADNEYVVNIGDFVSEMITHDGLRIPINAYIQAIKPAAIYDKPYFMQLYVSDREHEIPKDDSGASLKVQPLRASQL
jgi:hypothetical protein